MIKYIKKTSDEYVHEYVTVDTELPADEVGLTFEDYQNGLHILITDERQTFIELNPKVSAWEIIELTVSPVYRKRYYYTKKDIYPNFTILEEPMDHETNNIGLTLEDWENGYYIEWTELHFQFRREHLGISPEEVITFTIKVHTEEDIKRNIEIERNFKVAKIQEYDGMSYVNEFFYNDQPFWIDKATRVGLKNSTNDEIATGREMTTLILGDNVITLPCETVLNMLTLLEVYAKDCYNVTAQHIINVKSLQTLEEIINYDYKPGYPEKLHF